MCYCYNMRFLSFDPSAYMDGHQDIRYIFLDMIIIMPQQQVDKENWVLINEKFINFMSFSLLMHPRLWTAYNLFSVNRRKRTEYYDNR